jgi:iron complex outermembrane receptor protein
VAPTIFTVIARVHAAPGEVMYHSSLSRGVSAGAFALMLVTTQSAAQETLPTIDIGSDNRRRDERPLTGARAQDDKSALGGRLTGYNAPGSAAATKTDIPVLQTPRAIQIVPRQVLDDQQAVTVLDAVSKNVSSVYFPNSQFYDRFIIRGFDAERNSYRNGLRQYWLTGLETANLQSVEVLKGPAAMLYGRVEPGGLVNLTPKRPLLEPYFSVQEQAGSFGFTRTTIDATGPLNDEKSLAYRLNAVYLDTESHRDFIQRENVFVAPTISWRPSDRFTLNVDAEYQNIGFTADAWSGIPAIGRRPAGVPGYRVYTDPALTLYKPNRQERRFVGYDATFKIDDDWKVTSRFGYWNVGYTELDPYTTSFDSKTGAISREVWYIPYRNQRTISVNLDVQGRFETGPFTHRILLGGDFFDLRQRLNDGRCCDKHPLDPINIWNPIYASPGPAWLNTVSAKYNNRWDDEWKGIYAQDQISFMDDRVHILLGGRHDWASYGESAGSTPFLRDAKFSPVPVSAFSPNVGVLIQPVPWLSFYANYSRSVGSSNGRTEAGVTLPAQAGRQFEGGAKAELLDGALTTSIAYYAITKSNITVPTPVPGFVQTVGEAQSDGFEFDLSGRLDENWSVIANYSHTLARVTQDRAADGSFGNTGHRLPNVPIHSGNLWVKYEAAGAFRGLSLAGGVNVIGERKGDVENSFELPAYALLNAMAAYSFRPSMLPWVKNIVAQLNVTNILDTLHYTNANGRNSIMTGAPRAVMGSIRIEF